jgi:hypothetical protein
MKNFSTASSNLAFYSSRNILAKIWYVSELSAILDYCNILSGYAMVIMSPKFTSVTIPNNHLLDNVLRIY